MSKDFTRFEKSQIMNTAKVLKNFITKKDQLQKKIDELNKEITSVDEQQKRWEAPIMELLDGHRIEDVVEYKRELQASGKYSTKIVFRYPDTILPPEGAVDEGPEFDGAGFEGSEKETAIDAAVANNATVSAADFEKPTATDFDVQNDSYHAEEQPDEDPFDDWEKEHSPEPVPAENEDDPFN